MLVLQVEETVLWRQRFFGSLVITVPTMTLAMVMTHAWPFHYLMMPLVSGLSWRVALLWLLSTLVLVLFGAPFYISAWAALRYCVTNSLCPPAMMLT
jgi:cation transport ATPase